jgi:hypothetical protein
MPSPSTLFWDAIPLHPPPLHHCSASERGALACLWACVRWHLFYGRRFTLITDHQALQYNTIQYSTYKKLLCASYDNDQRPITKSMRSTCKAEILNGRLNARLNRRVLSFRLKQAMFSAERFPNGKEFHACGLANEKALSPNLERNLGVVKSKVDAERRPDRRTVFWQLFSVSVR